MRLCLPLLICLFATAASAQTGRIAGRVADGADGAPLPGATLLIEGTTIGTAAARDGDFLLEDVPTGRHTLLASFIGYQTLRVPVDVRAGVTTTLNVTFDAAAIVLQDVEVTGRRETTYDAAYSFAATRTATPIARVPQSLTVVTKEVIDDQQSFTLNETVRNVSGVNTFSAYNDLVTRGFRNQNVRLVNGLKTEFGFWTSPVLPHVERVEYLKGPASAIAGAANPGGTVNIVTKKPLSTTRQAVGFTAGSFGTYRAQADLTGPLGDNAAVLYRLNLGYEDTESFRFLQSSVSTLLAPSVSFLPSDRTRVNADLVYSRKDGKLDRGQAIFFGNTDLTSTPPSFSLSQPGDFQIVEDLHLTLSIEHALTDRVAVNASYMKYRYDENLSEHRTSNLFLPDDPTVLQLAYIRRIQDRIVDNLATYLTADVETGAFQHRALVGVDVYRQDDNVSQWGARGDEFLVASDGSTSPGGGVTDFDLDDPLYTLNRDPETYVANWFVQPRLLEPTRTASFGVYVQDQISTGDLEVLLGLRHEWYRSRIPSLGSPSDLEFVTQTAVLPRVGAVYALSDVWNAYATFALGFEPQSATIIQQPGLYGGPFDPETSDLFEVGAKGTLLGGRLLATAAVYQIRKQNVLVSANAPAQPELLESRGEVRSRGIELEAVGSLSPSLRITANYALNEALISVSDDPADVGLINENAPRHQGGLWGRYVMRRGPLSGVGVGAGVRFVSDRETFNRALQLPGYAVFDASLSYTIDRLRVTAYLDNLLDKTYWTGGYDYGRIYPGAPRTLRVSVAYTF